MFLGLGLLITLAVVVQTQHFIEREREAEFAVQATQVRNDLALHTYRHVDVLRTYQAEFAANPQFSDAAFQRMAEVLRLDERLPGIYTVGYVRRGEQSDAGGLQYVARFLHAPAPQYLLSDQLMADDPIRLEAMHRARDTGDVAATGPLPSALHPEAYRVFLAYLPLYEDGALPRSPEERRARFVGAVFVAIRPDRLLETRFDRSLMPQTHVRLAFERYANPVDFDIPGETVYDNMPDLDTTLTPIRNQVSVSLAGTVWSLELGVLDSQRAISQRWLPWTVLAMGALLSLLSAVTLAMLQRSREKTLRSASHDRSLRREAEAALLVRQRAIEASANAIVITSAAPPDYPVVYVNPAFERMTGYTAEEILGKSLRVMHWSDKHQEGLQELQRILAEQREGHATLRNYRKDGQLYWTRVHIAPVRDEAGQITHFVAAKYDITEMRRTHEKLEYQAWHDALTQLPNRHALRAKLTEAIRRAESGGERFWVAFLDLDNFKLMNDTLGHTVGDQALRQVAGRLQDALQGDDMVARRGGDEFVFILYDLEAPRNAQATLDRIMTAVARPMRLGAHHFYPTASMGVAIHPRDGRDPEILIRHADMAMGHAKVVGRNNYQFFSGALQQRALERVKLEGDLRKALASSQFELHFQPQLRLADDVVTGVEALVRWRHPERGMVPPDQFIPLAEETGLIVPLGEWILRNACTQAAQWQSSGMPPIRVAVNLSARQFNDDRLPSLIASVLQETGLPARCLELEITETHLMHDVRAANGILERLKGLGVTLSLDDFGTGYSSMAQLKHFPLDIIKIDRSFIEDIGSGDKSGAIARTIIQLAHNLDMVVLAEGVETAQQKAFLKGHGCDAIQGYLISRPLPAPDLERWILQFHGHAL